METAINLTAIIMSTIAILLSLCAIGVCLGMRWSTHKIEFKPLEINDPFKEEDFQPFTEPSEDIVQEALKLSRQGKERRKNKEEDPLDTILESNNF